MNLEKLAQMEAYMASKKAGHSELGLRKKEQYLTPRTSFLSKVKMVQGSSAMYVYPLELRLDFNPNNLADETFNDEYRFAMPYSVSDSIALLKTMAQNNPELHEKLAALAKISVAEYDLTDPTTITDNDKKALWRYRNVIVYNTLVQQFTMSGFGKFGRKGLSLAEFDEFGQATKKDLGYMLYELEVALANARIEQIEAEYAPGGPKADHSAEDLKADKKKVWEGLKVKNPKPAGVMRVIHIPCSADWKLKLDGDADPSHVTENMRDYEGYIGGSYDAVKEVESMLGTGYDVNTNYLEVAIHYPIGKGKTDGEKALNSYTNREFTKNPLNRVGTLIPGFDTAYNEFRSDEEIFNEETILKSVFEFRPIADDLLLEHYKADLGKKKHLITTGIADKYMELINRIDNTLSEEVMMNVISGEAKEGIANLEAPTENQKEYVIEDVERTEEDGVLPVEALMAETEMK